jgi:hypothetical protein
MASTAKANPVGTAVTTLIVVGSLVTAGAAFWSASGGGIPAIGAMLIIQACLLVTLVWSFARSPRTWRRHVVILMALLLQWLLIGVGIWGGRAVFRMQVTRALPEYEGVVGRLRSELGGDARATARVIKPHVDLAWAAATRQSDGNVVIEFAFSKQPRHGALYFVTRPPPPARYSDCFRRLDSAGNWYLRC